jgi:hypothetical protein
MTKRLLSPLLLVLALLGSTAFAQEGQETAQSYEVEVIVFKHWQAGGADAELPRSDVEPPAAERVASLDSAADGMTPLPENALRLQGVYQVLARSKDYQPLLHVGWRQQGLGREQAPAVAIPAEWAPGQEEPPALYGLIKVYKERFLHAVVDLRHQLADAQQGTAQIQAADGSMVAIAPPPAIVHQQERRMRSGELHYLDHPSLGVLIQVTPVEAAE